RLPAGERISATESLALINGCSFRPVFYARYTLSTGATPLRTFRATGPSSSASWLAARSQCESSKLCADSACQLRLMSKREHMTAPERPLYSERAEPGSVSCCELALLLESSPPARDDPLEPATTRVHCAAFCDTGTSNQAVEHNPRSRMREVAVSPFCCNILR